MMRRLDGQFVERGEKWRIWRETIDARGGFDPLPNNFSNGMPILFSMLKRKLAGRLMSFRPRLPIEPMAIWLPRCGTQMKTSRFTAGFGGRPVRVSRDCRRHLLE
jgi:hypothetical protein